MKFILLNSIKNIYRYKRNYMLYGILFFILICSASIFISVFSYTGMSIEALKMQYLGTVRIEKKPVQMPLAAYTDMSEFTKEEYLVFKKSPYVRNVRFAYFIFSTYQTQDDSGKSALDVALNADNETIELDDLFFSPLYIMGYDYDYLISDDRYILSEGRMYENDQEAVIIVDENNPYDKWNLLKIGDTVTVTNNDNLRIDYTVVGIMQESESSDLPEQVRRVLFTTVESAVYFRETIVHSPPSFHASSQMSFDSVITIGGFMVLVDLKSYEYYEDFMLEAFKNGYVITLLSEDYFAISRILYDSWSWSLLFLLIAAILIVSITVITTVLLLNSRKYEIAVLRSVGMKKSRLICGYLIENLAFIWGTTLVSIIAAQVIYFAVIAQKIIGNIDMSVISNPGNAAILFQNTALTFGATTLVVILSSVLSASYIIWFQPLKIFNKQH